MNSRLHTKIMKLEQRAAPLIELIRERWTEIAQVQEWVQPIIDAYLEAARYCGLPTSDEAREQIETDAIEEVLLTLRELGDHPMTQENTVKALTRARSLLCRERYGYEPTVEEMEASDGLAERLRADMRAGISAKDSAAARLFREAAFRPRLKKQTDSMRAYLAGSTVALN